LTATTALVSTAFPVNVTIGTSLATVVLIVFFDGIGDRYLTLTGFTSTFHGGDSDHGYYLGTSLLTLV
jgi:hypothetical protein